jgi:hypothetical protein
MLSPKERVLSTHLQMMLEAVYKPSLVLSLSGKYP